MLWLRMKLPPWGCTCGSDSNSAVSSFRIPLLGSAIASPASVA